MFSIADLKISRKLVLGFAAIIAVIGAVGAVTLTNTRIMNEVRVETGRANASLAAIADAQFRLARQENSIRGWLISLDPYYLERVESHRGKFNEALNHLRELSANFDIVLGATPNELEIGPLRGVAPANRRRPSGG